MQEGKDDAVNTSWSNVEDSNRGQVAVNRPSEQTRSWTVWGELSDLSRLPTHWSPWQMLPTVLLLVTRSYADNLKITWALRAPVPILLLSFHPTAEETEDQRHWGETRWPMCANLFQAHNMVCKIRLCPLGDPKRVLNGTRLPQCHFPYLMELESQYLPPCCHYDKSIKCVSLCKLQSALKFTLLFINKQKLSTDSQLYLFPSRFCKKTFEQFYFIWFWMFLFSYLILFLLKMYFS